TLGQLSTNSFTQTNGTPITISATDGSTAPYPSLISITGADSVVGKVSVSLHGLRHTWPDDLDVLLVSPQGRSVMLLSQAGGGNDVTNLDLTFEDGAGSVLPDEAPLVSGTWRPSNYGTNTIMPAPAPAPPYGSALSSFSGINPNGTWQLFIADHYPSDDGGVL